MRAHVPRLGMALGAVAVAVTVSAGAYAFGSSRGEVWAHQLDVAPSADISGADASSGGGTPSSEPSSEPSSTPSPTAAPSGSPTPKPSSSPKPTCVQGGKHAEVEVLLAQMGAYGSVTVDGHQSEADCVAVKRLSTQIVRKQAKAIFIVSNAARCMQRRHQRFPTVRTVG